MKRTILINCIVLFIMSSQAICDGQWPPSNVEIVPQNPISSDIVDITLSGEWPDSCIPSSLPIEVADNNIYFNVISDLNDICDQVITPWQLTESVGPLSPGTYSVYASLDRGPWTLMGEFNVTPHPGTGTHTYVFWPQYSTVTEDGGVGGIHETYTIEGQFQLTIDFDTNTASFDHVDANLSESVAGSYGQSLGVLFDMTELVGTVVSDTEIDFDTAAPLPGGKVVHLDVNICSIYAPTSEVYLTGGFCETWPDGYCYDMDAHALKKTIFYVNVNATGTGDGSSWENAFINLQDAIDAAGYGSEVWVAQGTYKPTNQRYSGEEQSAAFNLKNGVMVYGGFNGTETSRSQCDPNKYETILSGDIDDDGILDADNAWHVVEAETEAVSPTGGIDGFTVTGGYADGQSPENNGGGIYIQHESPTITNCKIIGNYASITGGGMFSNGGDSTVINCAFIGNSSGDGGGIGCWSGSPTLTNCAFSGNSAIGDGGGMGCADSNVMVINCTFAQNSADFKGGGIFCGIDSHLHITNCILWGNTAEFGPQIYEFGGSLVAAYSDVQGGYPGETNIDVDPLFVDPNGPDGTAGTEDDSLQLSADSLCIDVGDNSVVTVTTDLDGKPRIINSTVDMGAYEFQGQHLIYVDDDAPNDPGPGDPEVSDPDENGTQAHPFDNIQEAVDVAKDGHAVLVQPGSYTGYDVFIQGQVVSLDKNITLTSTNPADPNVVESTIIEGSVHFSGAEDPNCMLTGFRIHDIYFGAIYGNDTHATISHCVISGNGPCEATVIRNCDGTISNCLITDNTTFALCGVFPVVLGCNGLIKNCTIANNVSGLGDWDGGTMTMENCIIYDNGDEGDPQVGISGGGTLNVSYCNVQGGVGGIDSDGTVNWGLGNIDADPCFIRLGQWEFEPIQLIGGDYHLKSYGWRWDEENTEPRWEYWYYDYVTSRCIDAGNPGSPLGDELMSVPPDPSNEHGINLRINMGAYGGTSQASMAPYDWALLADLSNDGVVDYVDLAGQVENWLTIANEQPGDLNRDGVVNMRDFAALAEDWLQVTDWAE